MIICKTFAKFWAPIRLITDVESAVFIFFVQFCTLSHSKLTAMRAGARWFSGLGGLQSNPNSDIKWNIRCSSPLNCSAKQQRVYFDGFGTRRQRPPSPSCDWPSRGNIQYSPDWLAQSRCQQRNALISIPDISPRARARTHTNTRTHTHTACPDCRDETTATGRKIRPLIRFFPRGRRWRSPADGADFVKWMYVPRLPVRIAKSVARLLFQRKYTFRAGEEPTSRGQPKINKPYEKTKLCKTFILWPLTRGRARLVYPHELRACWWCIYLYLGL